MSAPGLVRALALGFTLTVLGHAMALAPAAAQTEPAREPCAAAKLPAAWGSILAVPAPLKRDAEAYRKAWREACAKGGGASLHALLVRATRLSDRFLALIRKQRVTGRKADRLQIQLTRTYPGFLPALHGSIIEFEFFEPDFDLFRASARLGDADDRLFFDNYAALFGDDFKVGPWLMRTWDYGGCLRFGSYDWVANLRRIDALRARLKGREYKRRLADLRARMVRTIQSLGQFREAGKPMICTCDATGAVASDLDRILRELGGAKTNDALAKAARQKLSGIRSGAILVRSQRVKHCSGG